MFQENSRKLFRIIWLQVGLLALTLSIFRLIFTFTVGDWHTINNVLSDYFNSVFVGFRFDMRAATIAFAPLFLVGLLLSGTRFFNYITRGIVGYSRCIFFLTAALSIGNYYYYKTYANHFDIFIFGLAEDDTLAVLKTMWQDYPIIRSFLCALLITIIASKIIQLAWKRIDTLTWPRRSVLMTTLSILFTIVVYVFFARGSLGTFPLKQYHANVSNYEVLNKTTPNALLALDWARSNRKKSQKFHPVSQNQYDQQVSKVLGQDSPVYRTDTNPYLEKHQPHVVFALMESMGGNLLIEDKNPNTDLLGALRTHYNQDFSFDRILAGTGGTINSIVMMLFNSNNGTISHGSEQKTVLHHTAFEPYKKSGYKIVYVTGGSPLWRNLKYYLPTQGVDEFYSEGDIYQAIPESKQYSNTWGAADEHTFQFAEQLLQNSKQPIMLMIQTQTNHPPYQIPSSYTPKPIEVSQYSIDKMQKEEPHVRKIHETYQYAANSLGNFVSAIKASPLGDKTLIAASGDHRLREYSITFPQDLGTAHSVPLYMYIPKVILEHSHYHYDKSRVGSHRDIFPTLYSYSLSNTEYYSLGGRNILASNDVEHPYGYGLGVTFTAQGVTYASDIEKLYPWETQEGLSVSKQAIPNPNPDLGKDYIALQTLFINSQLKGFRCDKSEICRVKSKKTNK